MSCGRQGPGRTGGPDWDEVAHRLLSSCGMTSPSETTPILRWIFQRGNDLVSCHVERANDQAYAVCLVPYGSEVERFVERCDAAISAFQRHASIAAYLRGNGWKLASYA